MWDTSSGTGRGGQCPQRWHRCPTAESPAGTLRPCAHSRVRCMHARHAHTCIVHMHLYGACTAYLSSCRLPRAPYCLSFPNGEVLPTLQEGSTGCCQHPGGVVAVGTPFSHIPRAWGGSAEGGGIPGGRALWVGDSLGHLGVGFPSPVLWWGPPRLHPHPKTTRWGGNETAEVPPPLPPPPTRCGKG